MLKDLSYIAFDFETTGLDPEKDEAIQIWIIKFNKNFEILEQFSSYIKPDNQKELSSIVKFTTWISIEQLQSAPKFDEIKKVLVNFFDENSILIWHNIQFDIRFMEKYLWKIPYLDSFDTYIYSRLLLHFQPSYALEILADKYWFNKNAHDALADSFMSIELFKILIKKTSNLIKAYPALSDLILKSDTIFNKILELKPINRNIFSIPKKNITIPKFKKISSNFKDINEFDNKTVFDTNWVNFDKIINFSLNAWDKIIFAFSSYARLSIARSYFQQNYIQTSTLNNWYTTNLENEKKLLKKEKIEEFEANYIIKAFSHYKDDLSIFDISNFNEKKIYNFLSDKQREIRSNIILTTHYDLFNFIKQKWKEQIKDYKIIFCDWHYWMNSLGKVVNMWFDFYELLNKLENIRYELSFDKKEWDIEKIIDEISIFFWSLSIKLQPLFKWTNNKLEIVDIFSDTRNDFSILKDNFYDIDKKIQKLDNIEIINYWNIFKDGIEHYFIVEQKLFWNWQLKYIFSPMMEHIDINSFNDFMENFTYYNFTVMENKKYIKLNEILWKDEKTSNFIEYWDNINFEKVIENIKNKILDKKSVFLVSNNKTFSQNLFKLIFAMKEEYNLNTDIYAENITWWQWKILYYLWKKHWPKITIWWPEFLLSNVAKHINYDDIHLISIWWRAKDMIIKDLKFYLK